MNPTAVMPAEIVDLGLAIGLLEKDGGSVEFNSDWFSDPGPVVSKALADEDRRDALVRFVDTVNGASDATQVGDITAVKLFDARDLGIERCPRPGGEPDARRQCRQLRRSRCLGLVRHVGSGHPDRVDRAAVPHRQTRQRHVANRR